MTETPRESGGGHAEEQPGDLEPDGGGDADARTRDRRHEDDGEGKGPGSESGDGKATGNPRSAG